MPMACLIYLERHQISFRPQNCPLTSVGGCQGGARYLLRLTGCCDETGYRALQMRGLGHRVAGTNVFCAHRDTAPLTVKALWNARLGVTEIQKCTAAWDADTRREGGLYGACS